MQLEGLQPCYSSKDWQYSWLTVVRAISLICRRIINMFIVLIILHIVLPLKLEIERERESHTMKISEDLLHLDND